MSDWVKLDADFGAPILRLVVNLRDVAYREDYLPLRAILAGELSRGELPAAADLIATFIERKRPDLMGLSVIGISKPWHGGLRFAIDVVHPLVGRTPIGEIPPEQRLEVCWTCGKPLLVDLFFLRNLGPLEIGRGTVVEVCSEACMTANRLDMQSRPRTVDVMPSDSWQTKPEVRE